MLMMEMAESRQGHRRTGGETNVWIIPLANSLASAQACLPWLDKQELARMMSLYFVVDRILYAESHGWLRRILSEYTGIPPGALRFSRSLTGKPVLERHSPDSIPAIYFSVSRTHGCLAIAISEEGEVGVDIERVRHMDAMDGIDKMVLHPDEHAWLDSLQPGQKYRSFFRLWAAKEAYTKALGRGLAQPFDQLSVQLLDESLCRIRDSSIAPIAQEHCHCSMLISPGSPLDEFAFATVSISGNGAIALYSVMQGCKPTEPSIGATCKRVRAD